MGEAHHLDGIGGSFPGREPQIGGTQFQQGPLPTCVDKGECGIFAACQEEVHLGGRWSSRKETKRGGSIRFSASDPLCASVLAVLPNEVLPTAVFLISGICWVTPLSPSVQSANKPLTGSVLYGAHVEVVKIIPRFMHPDGER